MRSRFPRCIQCLYGALLLLVVPSAVAAPQVEWKVVNRFPLFASADAFKRIEESWKGSAAEWIDRVGFTARARELLPVGKTDTAWRSATGTYDKSVLFPEKHAISARLSDASGSELCVWRDRTGEVARQPCTAPVEVAVPTGQQFELVVTSVSGTELARLQAGPIRERLIVGLGDSFGSGEGNPDHPAELAPSPPDSPAALLASNGSFVRSSAAWWDEACHRSLLSWPALAALRSAIENTKEVIQFASFACSGAEIGNGILWAQLDPPGQSSFTLTGCEDERDGGGPALSCGHKYEAVQLSQQHALAVLLCNESPTERELKYGGQRTVVWTCAEEKQRPVDALYLSVGGNDVNFGSVVKWMVLRRAKHQGLTSTLSAQVLKLLDRKNPERAAAAVRHLGPKYQSLSTVLRLTGIPANAIYVLLYPDPLRMSDSTALACVASMRDGNLPLHALLKSKGFEVNVEPDPHRLRRVSSAYAAQLLRAQDSEASRAGWNKINSIPLFDSLTGAGRGYCSTAPACTTRECAPAIGVGSGLNSVSQERLGRLDEFQAYDGARLRSIRFASDALLTGATVKGHALTDSWISGMAHPTANMHARIADLVSALRTMSKR